MKCYYCGRPAVAVCRLCGRPVCRNHLGEGSICSVCRELLCRLCGKRLSVVSCISCGRPVCDECSFEVKPGIRMCRECWLQSKGSLDELVKREWERMGRKLASIVLSLQRPGGNKM